MATWAETVLASDLGCGTDDPRASAPDLLRRAVAALPERARAGRRVAMRADPGYFAGQLARAAHGEQVAFASGARRIGPVMAASTARDALTTGPHGPDLLSVRVAHPIEGHFTEKISAPAAIMRL